MVLEKKRFNADVKAQFLDRRDPSWNFKSVDRNRLQVALQTALDWQTEIADDFSEHINDHTYIGPHKWIVCLVGPHGYTAGTFMTSNESVFRSMPNFSISVMCLSEAPISKKMCHHYQKLALSTPEGTFCNLVDIPDTREVQVKATDDTKIPITGIPQQFFGSMEVYPSEEELGQLYIKEHFSIL